MEPLAAQPAQILIVEDEKIIAKDLEIRLKRMNYAVVGSVTNSEDCLQVLTEVKPDLILMDIMIDGPMDGIETSFKVRALYDIPIIFLTAYADEGTFQRAKLSDPFGYILKPFQERELDLSIQTVLQKHRLERRIRENEVRYRLLFESTQEAIVVLDDDACLVDGNAATEALFGLKREAMLGKNFNDLSGQDEPVRFAASWKQELTDGLGQGQHKIMRPDGQARIVDYSIRLQYMPGRHLAVLRDVTQKLQDQQEIEALARIPAEAPNPILRFTPTGELLYANKHADKLINAWGGADALVLPRQVMLLLNTLSAVDAQGDEIVQIGGRFYQLLAVFIPKTGYINIYATDITDQHFSEGLMVFQRDVLEQVALGQRLQETLARLVDGLDTLLPELTAVLIWRYTSSEEYQCVTGKGIQDPTVIKLFVSKNGHGALDASMGLKKGIKAPLHNLLSDLNAARAAHQQLQVAVHTMPGYVQSDARASFLLFWPVGRLLTAREESVTRLAMRLSFTAFERDATFQRLSQQSLAFENINDAIILTNEEGIITEWSPSAERIFQHSKQDMAGRKMEEVISFHVEQTPGPMQKTQNGVLIDLTVASFTRPDGSAGWVELSRVDMADASGSVLGQLQVARDITQKRYVEEQLNISEQHLKAIFENSIQSFVLLDLNFRVVAYNRQAERWVNDFASKRLRKGVHGTQFWPSNHSSKLRSYLRAAVEGSVMGYEDLFQVEERSFWLEISLIPVRDARNRVTGVCITALDISERKTNEQVLARSEARFRSLVQNSSDLVLLLDEEGKIEYASESSSRITGYSPSELVGARITKHVHDRDKLRLLEAVRRSVDREDVNVQLEYRFIKADGQMLTLESLLTNELDNSSIHALVINSRDVTERKLAEESLRNLVRGISPYSGEDYFVFLIDNLAVHLSLPNVALVEFREDDEQFALALVQGGNPCKALSLGKLGAFSREIMANGFVYIPNIAGSTFAKDPLLKRFDASFAIGVAMRDYAGRNLGFILAAGQDRPANISVTENMIKIFSFRAANEFERIKITHALSESKASLTALVENTTDAIWSIDQAYNITALNLSFRNRFAHMFSDGVEIGDKVLILMKPDQAEQWQGYYDLAIAGFRHTEEISTSFLDIQVEYEVSFNPILSDDKQVSGVSVFARDITERKRAELALRASEANLSALIENTDDIIYSLDTGHKVVTTNSSFARVLTELGTTPDPHRLEEIGHVAFGEAWADLYTRAFGGEKFHEELPIVLGGASRSIEASFNPILTKDRTVAGISVMARDITERKRAEDELKRTNFELDSFVYRASHDLRAPLRSVLGLVNLIKVEKEETQRGTYLALAEKSINKLDTFISDLTHFSRNTRLSVDTSVIDFHAQLAECIENLRYMEKADRVKAIIDIETDGPFYSDPQRIGIIFQNLVSNAIKYQSSHTDSFVRVTIRTNAKEGTIVVQDNGKGIHREYLARIFEMFFRASEDSYGSGLGLYITQQVVEKLSGHIKVESDYGEGTTFSITLPNKPPMEENPD